MYQNYPNYGGTQSYPNYQSCPGCVGQQGYYMPYGKGSDDRIFPFAAPFLLGGLAGAAIAPAFYRPYPAPFYPPYPYPYRPYW